MLNVMKLVNEFRPVDLDGMLKKNPAKAGELLLHLTTYSDLKDHFADLTADEKADVISYKDDNYFFSVDQSDFLYDAILDQFGSEDAVAKQAKKHCCYYDQKDKVLYVSDLFNDRMNAFNYFLSGKYGEEAVAQFMAKVINNLSIKFDLHYNPAIIGQN